SISKHVGGTRPLLAPAFITILEFFRYFPYRIRDHKLVESGSTQATGGMVRRSRESAEVLLGEGQREIVRWKTLDRVSGTFGGGILSGTDPGRFLRLPPRHHPNGFRIHRGPERPGAECRMAAPSRLQTH